MAKPDKNSGIIEAICCRPARSECISWSWINLEGIACHVCQCLQYFVNTFKALAMVSAKIGGKLISSATSLAMKRSTWLWVRQNPYKLGNGEFCPKTQRAYFKQRAVFCTWPFCRCRNMAFPPKEAPDRYRVCIWLYVYIYIIYIYISYIYIIYIYHYDSWNISGCMSSSFTNLKCLRWS